MVASQWTSKAREDFARLHREERGSLVIRVSERLDELEADTEESWGQAIPVQLDDSPDFPVRMTLVEDQVAIVWNYDDEVPDAMFRLVGFVKSEHMPIRGLRDA